MENETVLDENVVREVCGAMEVLLKHFNQLRDAGKLNLAIDAGEKVLFLAKTIDKWMTAQTVSPESFQKIDIETLCIKIKYKIATAKNKTISHSQLLRSVRVDCDSLALAITILAESGQITIITSNETGGKVYKLGTE